MKLLIECLKNKQFSLSVAESFTAGLFCEQLGQVPGVSTVFKGGVVAYAEEAKVNLLNIDQELIDKHGVISAEIALAMAKQVKLLLNTEVSIAFTGNAGPVALENKAVGLWYLAVCIHDSSYVYAYRSSLSRNDMRNEAVIVAQQQLIDRIKEFTQ